jgi:hypothetical protein
MSRSWGPTPWRTGLSCWGRRRPLYAHAIPFLDACFRCHAAAVWPAFPAERMRALLPLLPALVAALALWAEAPWQAMALFALPAAIWAPGWGWVQWLHRNSPATTLQLLVDSAWAGLAIAWINVALLRELGLVGTPGGGWEWIHGTQWTLWTLSLFWTLGGMALARGLEFPRGFPRREKIGAVAVLLAVLFVSGWKSTELSRPLDGYWYLHAADDPSDGGVAMRAARNWSEEESIGWPEAGAARLVPATKNPDLVATERVKGRLVLAVRGPVGSYISAGGEKNTVQSSMAEPGHNPSEGPVRRYLDRGVAAISVWVDLQPGEYLGVDVVGEEVYLVPGSEAVWALHATGALRYTFHYQILNQVENLVWAHEILGEKVPETGRSRRFTWNQPPGWSPLLAASMVFTSADMQGAASLFLWVLLLVGFSGVRLASLAAPRAEEGAFLLPAALVLVHALLMIEPGSFNFPDSLYAAALLGTMIQVLGGTPKGVGAMGMLAQALRWPGGILASVFALLGWRFAKRPPGEALAWLWGLVALGAAAAGLAVLTGDAEDLLFILWFETFPEHWHGNFSPVDLLSRVPGFYGLWAMYTGGSLLLALPFVLGAPTQSRRNLQLILGSALVYSLFLATIDHHPSHYFLPLVAFTGPSLVCASDCLREQAPRRALVLLSLFGIGIYLWNGVV